MQIINAINFLVSHLGGTDPNEQFGTHEKLSLGWTVIKLNWFLDYNIQFVGRKSNSNLSMYKL